jgi:hypothetical protein
VIARKNVVTDLPPTPRPTNPAKGPRSTRQRSDKSFCTVASPRAIAAAAVGPLPTPPFQKDCSASSLTRSLGRHHQHSPPSSSSSSWLFVFRPHRPMAPAVLPPLVLPPWLVGRDRYNIKLPHIDTLLAIADKGRRPRRNSCPIGPEPSGLYKTAQDTVVTRTVPKLAVPSQYVLPLFPTPYPPPSLRLLCFLSAHTVSVAVLAVCFFLSFFLKIDG